MAVCWLIVEPPRIRPPEALRFIASSIASKSKPLCWQNLLSSAPIAARTMSRSISSRLIQSFEAAPRDDIADHGGGDRRRHEAIDDHQQDAEQEQPHDDPPQPSEEAALALAPALIGRDGLRALGHGALCRAESKGKRETEPQITEVGRPLTATSRAKRHVHVGHRHISYSSRLIFTILIERGGCMTRKFS